MNKRILMFTMGNWSHSNDAIVKALKSKLPQWEIIVIDLFEEFKKNWRGLLACMLDIPLLAWHALLDRAFSRSNILYAPATSRFINRIARRFTQKLQPDFTLQTTTRFNAATGLAPHFTVIDMAVAAARQSYRDLFNSTDRALDRLHAYQQRVYSSSSAVFAMGKYVRDSLVSDYQMPPQRAFAIGAGPNIDLGKRSAVAGSQRILFVGTNWQRKGGPALLAAFRQIRQKYPAAVLDIVGCNPEVDEAGVNIIGRVARKDLHQHFTEARVFALPTVLEAFGIAFVEALHFGLPIIGTSIGAIPEMVENGVNGFTVKPGDVAGIAAALDRILGDEALALRLGEASWLRAAQFTWDRTGSLLCTNMLSLVHDVQPALERPLARQAEQSVA